MSDLIPNNYKEALEIGSKFYFTGEPCSRGHVCNRYAKKRACVLCVREDSYRRSQTEKVKEQNRAYKKTPEYKQSAKDYKQRVGNEKEKARIAQDRKLRPSHYRERDRVRRNRHKKSRSDYNKRWHKSNQLSVSIREVAKRIEIYKRTGERLMDYESAVGYTKDEFIARIESTFKDGMSWENRSEWHIDHIKPIKQFILEGNYDLKEIHALSNLQALWAHENQSKGAKYDQEQDGVD